MAHIRSSNGASHASRNAAVPAVLEHAALDDLGPIARNAIANGPMPILAYPIMDQIVKLNEKIEEQNKQREAAGQPLRPYLDPKDPNLDRALAQGILNECLQAMNKDRELDFCMEGLKPFRPRANPRTAREEARAERLARRMRW